MRTPTLKRYLDAYNQDLQRLDHSGTLRFLKIIFISLTLQKIIVWQSIKPQVLAEHVQSVQGLPPPGHEIHMTDKNLLCTECASNKKRYTAEALLDHYMTM